MAKKKFSYYIGVLMNDGKIKFVTSINVCNKSARWESGKQALDFSMAEADSIVFGLLMNFHYAFTVKVPYGIEFFNPAESEENVNE